ncbi:hypothetical protein CASFOL_003905 [Castilleja foliolosa]|uniref:Uncharacterized protein n=1 Tax=Castilleja foliolosa TaxID=1961234 RepID=A0ABD3EJ02_9LAMI
MVNSELITPFGATSNFFVLYYADLDLKTDVADHGSATWFLQDLASEQDAEGTMVLELSGVFEADGLRFRNNPANITTAVGQMVYLANLRLEGVATNVFVSSYEPMLIKVGNGLVVLAPQSGRLPMAEVFKSAILSFKVNH